VFNVSAEQDFFSKYKYHGKKMGEVWTFRLEISGGSPHSRLFRTLVRNRDRRTLVRYKKSFDLFYENLLPRQFRFKNYILENTDYNKEVLNPKDSSISETEQYPFACQVFE